MAKHRTTVFNVIRESIEYTPTWKFDCISGTYLSPERAEEMCGVFMQQLIDQFPDVENSFRFTVKPSTYYDE